MSATVSGIESFAPGVGTRFARGMTREQFIAKCAKRSGTTPEDVLEYHEIAECKCGKKKCPGWVAMYKLRNRREPRNTPPRTPIKSKPATFSDSGYVYFAALGNLIKIGWSSFPPSRARDLNASLIGSCTGTREMEKRLHHEFAHLRESGEWFRTDPTLLEKIEALCK